ncbi:MAG: WD40 repeat domain-containing protein [Planctomycetaceae bacterium]
MRLWDTDTGELLRVLTGHSSDVNGVAFSPDGDVLATISDDHTIGLWNPDSGERAATLRGHRDMVTGLAYSPDGTILATGDADGVLKTWDASTGEVLNSISAHPGRINSVCVNSEGTQIATCGKDEFVRVWSLSTLENLFEFASSKDQLHVQSVAYQPGTDRLFSLSRSGKIRAWNTETGQLDDEFNTEQFLLGFTFLQTEAPWPHPRGTTDHS